MITIAVASPSFTKNEILREELEFLGVTIKYNPKKSVLNNDELIKFLNDAEVAIIGTETINQDIVSKCNKLKFIGKYGVGLNNIDFDALNQANIEIGWTSGVNKRCVAEITLGFMLSLIHNMYQNSIALNNGQWIKNGGFQLSEKTIGIIGVGHIGKDLINLLKPFDCNLLVNDIIDQKKFYNLNQLIETSKETIYKDADIITIHTPLTDKTYNMIDKQELLMMKKNTLLINTARGGIINELALEDALNQNIIAGAALDVYKTEPPTNNTLLSSPNLFCTPHIGGNAVEASLAMGRSTIDHIKTYLTQ